MKRKELCEMQKSTYLSVVDYIRQQDKKRNGAGIAIEYGGNQITRNEYWRTIDKYGQYLRHIGFFYGCEKPVTICNLNTPEYEFIYMALLELGAICSTVSLSFFKSDIKRHSIGKGADTIVLSVEFISPELKESFKKLGNNDGENRLQRIIFTSARDYRLEEKERKYISQFDYKTMINSLELPKNIEIIFPGELKEKSSNQSTSSITEQSFNLINANATYSNTGGTTSGIPKCVVHTHEAIIELLKAHEKDVFPDFPLKEGDKTLLLIPISHITAQFYAMLVRRAVGANIVYNTEAFESNLLTKALIEAEINDVVAPFGLYTAMAHSSLKKGDLRHLRMPTCGGESTPKGPTKIVNERLKWAGAEPIAIGGGSTEFGSATMISYGLENRSNETGLSLPGVENIIINPLTGKKASDGADGILYTNCPWQMKEYLNDEKATKEFFNYMDENGKIFGTNNDIGKIVGEYKGRPVFSLQGRATDFVLRIPGTKRYTRGITFTNGRVNPVDFKKGHFLFNMRDRLLNVPGILEAEALLISNGENDKSGTPVVNIVIASDIEPLDVLRAIYSSYGPNEVFKPEGVIFRTNFARSLATDKRETTTLHEVRKGYYKVGDDGNIYTVEIPENGNVIYTLIDDISLIQRIAPPLPKRIEVKQ
ncbi:MAG: long-chain fatty acid--CoA ligase [Nitrososphaerota archaeon]|jgi:acyl-CoA synthetase (AMP-forming)/AMP-acid ligase II|nr:long-chain fatty acid--CoA ligase [Nitrososphaerota archaeon]